MAARLAGRIKTCLHRVVRLGKVQKVQMVFRAQIKPKRLVILYFGLRLIPGRGEKNKKFRIVSLLCFHGLKLLPQKPQGPPHNFRQSRFYFRVLGLKHG